MSFLGSVVSGLLGFKSDKQDRKLQAAALDQANRFHHDQLLRYDLGYQDYKQFREQDYQRSLTGPADQMKNIVDMAGQSGIHPLAALGVSSSYSPAGAASPGIPSSSPGSVTPVGDSSSAFLGDAVGQIAEKFSKVAQEKQDRTKRYEEAQIKRLEAETAQLDEATSRTQIANRRAQATGGPNPDAADPKLGGQNWHINPNTTSTEAIEERYGDVVSWAYGAAVAGSDAWHTLKKKTGTKSVGEFINWLANKSLDEVKTVLDAIEGAPKPVHITQPGRLD